MATTCCSRAARSRPTTSSPPKQTLAEDADFAGDREALGGDQIALAWADLYALQSLAAEQAAAEGVPADMFGDEALSGRVILGVHAQDDALELVGLDFSVSDVGVPSAAPTRLAQGLPEDTLAAVSASGLGDRAVAYWETLQQTGAFPEGEAPLPRSRPRAARGPPHDPRHRPRRRRLR